MVVTNIRANAKHSYEIGNYRPDPRGFPPDKLDLCSLSRDWEFPKGGRGIGWRNLKERSLQQNRDGALSELKNIWVLLHLLLLHLIDAVSQRISELVSRFVVIQLHKVGAR